VTGADGFLAARAGIATVRVVSHDSAAARIDVTVWLLGVVRSLVAAQAAAGGSVVGTVTDAASGAPISGAIVALADLHRTAVSDANGRYVVRDIPAGPQHVSVRRIGFAQRVLHALVPRLGDVVIDFALERLPVRLQAVDVHPSVEIRGIDHTALSGGLDRTVTQAAMRNHPLLSEPDAFLAVVGGSIVASPETPNGLHVRGGASDQTGFLLDGIPVLSPYHAAGTFSAWNPDAIERLVVSPPSPAEPAAEALSGVVEGTTRVPTERLVAQGSFSTTQARATIDGPLGFGGVRFLASVRSVFPGFVAPKHEASYLNGTTHDALLTLSFPLGGGRAHVLGYTSTNTLDASASARDSIPPFDNRRNAFSWDARSVGAAWSRAVSTSTRLTVRGWRAESDAHASWNADPVSERLAAIRRDDGAVAVVEHAGTSTLTAGLQLRRSLTDYGVSENETADGFVVHSRAPVVTLFGSHERALGAGLATRLAASASTVSGHVYARSYAELRWATSPSVTLTTAYIHAHQVAQTLRNPESIVGEIFPVDLFVVSSGNGVPVARSDDVILSAAYRPLDGVRFGVEVYTRTLGGLALVAPTTDAPFSQGGFVPGAGTSDGVSFDVAARGARYGFIASYGWQRGSLEYRGTSFVPSYATTHLLETGVILFPTATSSVRIGIIGAAGRHATGVSGAFEWEACNLLDRGCEFAGSPRTASALGGVSVPPYLRIDVGARKHWHIDMGRHDALVALFATVTNVLGRPNVLTLASDPTTREPVAIGMRPLAPLAIGLDWQF
jgi:hypothetical protein